MSDIVVIDIGQYLYFMDTLELINFYSIEDILDEEENLQRI